QGFRQQGRDRGCLECSMSVTDAKHRAFGRGEQKGETPMNRQLGLWVLALTLAPSWALGGTFQGGIGALGDSYTDEYEFYPPDRSSARTWLETLVATRGLNFGAFSTVGRGEPRNQGCEYNWARSDATTEDMIRTGQHTGLAAQVARG